MAFTYKGINAKDMHLRVSNELEFESATRDLELMAVPGRDGDLFVDNGRYNSVIRKLPCHLHVPKGCDVEEAVSNIHQWLVVEPGSHELLFNHEPDFIYHAAIEDAVSTSRILSQLGKVVINFRLHPLKFLRTGLVQESIYNNQILRNDFNIATKPIINVVGSGDVDVTIGSQLLRLRGVDRGVTVDVENQSVMSFDGQRPAFDRVHTYPFPVLNPGDNTITWNNPDFSISIIPRWGVLV